MKKSRAPQISFEFYPPKTEEGKQKLIGAAKMLNALQPSFFSVTFGAGGSTREGTLATFAALLDQTTTPIAPHLSCVGMTKLELATIVADYQVLDVNRLVALRGDLPSGSVAAGDFRLAHEFVKWLRDEVRFSGHIEVAAYPECHPQAKNAWYDIVNLKQKYEAGANSAITQYFFNADAFLYFQDECIKHHITMPIIPGIMPIMQFTKLVRFSDICGAEIPRWLYKRLEAYGDDITALREFGIEVITKLCHQLIAAGVPALHFYTLNQAEICHEIINNLGLNVITWAKQQAI